MRTAFTELVGCEAPIQLAGMGVGTVELAVAVARAGGLGTISSTWLGSPSRAVQRIQAAGDIGGGALAVNVLLPMAEQVDLIETVAPHVRAIDFFWGPPDAQLIDRAHAGGSLAIWQVGSADEARAAQDNGCDLVVAQGSEAGGHVRSSQPLLEILEDVLDAVNLPVLAAGGIGSARQLAAVLAAGAVGARVGTRFAAVPESGAHPEYTAALIDAQRDESELTTRFNVGCPLCPSTHRVLRRCLDAASGTTAESVVTVPGPAGATLSLPPFHGMFPTPKASGDINAMALYAGRGVGHCHAGDTAASIVDELVNGAQQLLDHVGRRSPA